MKQVLSLNQSKRFTNQRFEVMSYCFESSKNWLILVLNSSWLTEPTVKYLCHVRLKMFKFPIDLPLAGQTHSPASNTEHKVAHTAALAHTKRTWYRIHTCLSQDVHEWSSEPALCRILPLASYLPIKSQSIRQSPYRHIHNCHTTSSYFRQSVKLVSNPSNTPHCLTSYKVPL